jgi:hypothetical protein
MPTIRFAAAILKIVTISISMVLPVLSATKLQLQPQVPSVAAAMEEHLDIHCLDA